MSAFSVGDRVRRTKVDYPREKPPVGATGVVQEVPTEGKIRYGVSWDGFTGGHSCNGHGPEFQVSGWYVKGDQLEKIDIGATTEGAALCK